MGRGAARLSLRLSCVLEVWMDGSALNDAMEVEKWNSLIAALFASAIQSSSIATTHPSFVMMRYSARRTRQKAISKNSILCHLSKIVTDRCGDTHQSRKMQLNNEIRERISHKMVSRGSQSLADWGHWYIVKQRWNSACNMLFNMLY